MSLLELKNVSKSFGGLKVIDDVSFKLNDGEIVGIIGPNGAGKTTLYNLIAGFYEPNIGDILFNSEIITGKSPHDICKRGISRTFQITQVFSDFTAFENVLAGALNKIRNLSEAKLWTQECLEYFGLYGKGHMLTKNLTLVDKKQIELARAFATKPKLMLLDEVISGLTNTEIIQVMKKIDGLLARNISISMIEHVMKSIMTMSHRVIVISAGKKIAEGTPTEVSKDERVIDAYLGKKYDFNS